MGRERTITIYVSSNSIVIEMIKKDTLSENRVILKSNFKIQVIPFHLYFFFCLQKHFALLIYQFKKQKTQKKKKKKKPKKTLQSCLHSFECFEK